MRNLAIAVVMFAVFSAAGCAVVQMNVRPAKAELEEMKIKEVKMDPVHAKTVLFVNPSPGVEQECLVFEGFYGQDQLLQAGEDGLAELRVPPVGYFKVKPALGGALVEYSEKTVGLFEPQQEYTVLCFTKTFDGDVVNIQPILLVPPKQVLRTQYRYYRLGREVWRWVNMVVFLPPYAGRPQPNTVTLAIDLNRLVAKVVRQLAGE